MHHARNWHIVYIAFIWLRDSAYTWDSTNRSTNSWWHCVASAHQSNQEKNLPRHFSHHSKMLFFSFFPGLDNFILVKCDSNYTDCHHYFKILEQSLQSQCPIPMTPQTAGSQGMFDMFSLAQQGTKCNIEFWYNLNIC